VWDDINRVDSAEEYRKAHQTGSRALYFAQCSDENETWLPLLEKAYAKAHGDFASIDGGFTGEAIEDLTGGVTTEIYSTDILDREAFWRDELLQVGSEFLFGCATGFYANWLDTSGVPREREGISEGHAYSIMDAKEIKGQRLLKLRNPWGKKEWTGRWSDGSSEWTPEWMNCEFCSACVSPSRPSAEISKTDDSWGLYSARPQIRQRRHLLDLVRRPAEEVPAFRPHAYLWARMDRDPVVDKRQRVVVCRVP
jgi:hypothetical protein